MMKSAKCQEQPKFRKAISRSAFGCAMFLAGFLLAAPFAAAEPASPWTIGALSNVRLIGGALTNGMLKAGVEITLKNGAHTYWRHPGDGGIPPSFDFSGSTNVKSVSVSYPAPVRSGEAGMQIFGYEKEVIFPLSIIPANPAMPVTLALHFNFAACEKICMPAEARMKLELAPAGAEGAFAARIASFEAKVPVKADGLASPALDISRDPARDKVWRVIMRPAPGPAADLFAEGPDGWFFDTKTTPDGSFELILAEKPADAGTKLPPVTLTLTTAKGAFEFVRHLDAAAATP